MTEPYRPKSARPISEGKKGSGDIVEGTQTAYRPSSARPIAKEEIVERKSIYPEVGVEAGGTGAGNIALSTIQGTGKDLTAIPAHFFNQMLENAPRSAVETFTDYEYPEDTTSMTAGILAKGAGVTGALKSPLSKTLVGGKGNLVTRMAKTGLAGAAYSPEDFTDVGQRATQGIVGAAMPLAGAGVSRAFKIGGDIGRRLSGVPSKSVKWLKERGASKIFDAAKEQVDYVQNTLAPQAYEVFQDSVNRFTPSFKKYAEKTAKMTTGAIDSISKRGTQAVREISKQYNDSVYPIVQKIDDAMFKLEDDASRLYDEAATSLDAVGNKVVPAKNSLGASLKVLQDNGIEKVGKTYNLSDIDTPELKVIAKLYNDIVQNKGTLSSAKFRGNRKMLRNAQRGKSEFNKDVGDVVNSLYDDMEVGGATKINEAKAGWRKYKTAEKNYKNKYNENKLSRYHKLNQAEKKTLLDMENDLGVKFIDDVDAITATRELQKAEAKSQFDIGKKLQGAADPKSHSALREELRPMFGDKTDEIFDNIKDHMVAQQLSGKAAIGSTAESRIIPALVKSGAKQYYEKVMPKVTQAKNLLSKTKTGLRGLQNL